MCLFAVTTLMCLASTALLNKAPLGPASSDDERASAHGAIHRSAYLRFVAWGMTHIACMCCTAPYLPKLLIHAGIETAQYAFWQSLAALPCMLFGFFFAGRALRRYGSVRTLIAVHILLLMSDASFLMIVNGSMAWMLPICLALSGFSRGMYVIGNLGRLYDVIGSDDQRTVTIFLAAGGVAGAFTAVSLMPIVSALEHSTVATNTPWWIILGAVGIRLCATPLTLVKSRLA
jgi:hypothetical protein